MAEGMNSLSVEEKVNVKSKNLDVLSEYQKTQRKKAMNFAVIGSYYPSLCGWTPLTSY